MLTSFPNPAQRRTPRRRWLRRALWIALFTILLAEVGLRAAYSDKLKLCRYPPIYRPDPVLGYRYVPNSSGRLVLPDIEKLCTINSRGYPGRNFPVVKPAGTVRIAVLGQSNETGFWMEGRVPWTEHLQNLFDRQERDVEVLNLAIDGEGRAVSMIRQIQEEVLAYEPDIILMPCTLPLVHAQAARDLYRGYVITYDSGRPGAKEGVQNRVDRIESRWIFKALYRASYIVRAACRLYARHYDTALAKDLLAYAKRRAEGPVRNYFFRGSDAVDRLVLLDRYLRNKRSIRLVLFSYRDHARSGRLLGPTVIPYWILSIPPTPQYYNDGLIGTHFNEAGHRVIAEQIFVRLQKLLKSTMSRD